MSGRATAKVAKAMDIADRLAANGKSGWAQVVRDICRQNSAYRMTCQRLYNDNLQLRAAQGIDTRSAIDAKRRGPEGESPVAKGHAPESSSGSGVVEEG